MILQTHVMVARAPAASIPARATEPPSCVKLKTGIHSVLMLAGLIFLLYSGRQK